MRHATQISKEYLPKTLEERALMEKILYASAIGSIINTMLWRRLDMDFALSVTIKF